jgi:N6-L-threonylcarbamoyladenine synthase
MAGHGGFFICYNGSMRVLGIETSCDETSVAVVKNEGEVFDVQKNLISSQIKDHEPYGGVVPEIAARRHIDVLFPMLESAGISRSGRNIDAIAVTAGPGLVPALRVGVEAAKTLAFLWRKPLVAVNHLEGHIYSVYLPTTLSTDQGVVTSTPKPPELPALCLLVSGGHTELVLMKEHGVYELVGETRDDAAGEAFDKVAHLLQLTYPGGPSVSKHAAEGNPSAIPFPRPMIDSADFDFSFAGLKTAVLVYLKDHPVDSPEALADVCASFQEAVVDALVTKTVRAAEAHRPKSVILTGGVSANTRLRTELAFRLKTTLPEVRAVFAPIEYTGDNAAMIAAAGLFRAQREQFVDPLSLVADPNLRLA